MKLAWIGLLLGAAGLFPPLAMASQPLPPPLAELARTHQFPLQLRDGSLAGAGAERLLAEARTADLLMLGENHGVADIADLALALYRQGAASQPRRLVTEIGPASAVFVEEMARAGTLRDFLARGVNLHALPFFGWAEEMPLIDAAVAAHPGSTAIWGLDQEFIAAAPLLLPRLSALASTDAQHAAVASARRWSLVNPFLIGVGNGRPLQGLAEAFAGAGEAARLADDLVLSHRIYRAQMGGEAQWSNQRREALLMENFLAHVAGSDARPAPMFLKFGAFHLFGGRSPTVPEGFGLAISEWAERQGLSTLNIFADCDGGTMRDGLFGREVPCEPFLAAGADGFQQLRLEGAWSLFDLRPLRGHPALADTSMRIQLVVQGYDYLLLAPNPRAATFLPGTLVTHRYGAILIVALGLALGVLIWLLLRWRRRRSPVLRQ